jgi:hypothetical protein
LAQHCGGKLLHRARHGKNTIKNLFTAIKNI